jgi:hypothetical protein
MSARQPLIADRCRYGNTSSAHTRAVLAFSVQISAGDSFGDEDICSEPRKRALEEQGLRQELESRLGPGLWLGWTMDTDGACVGSGARRKRCKWCRLLPLFSPHAERAWNTLAADPSRVGSWGSNQCRMGAQRQKMNYL